MATPCQPSVLLRKAVSRGRPLLADRRQPQVHSATDTRSACSDGQCPLPAAAHDGWCRPSAVGDPRQLLAIPTRGGTRPRARPRHTRPSPHRTSSTSIATAVMHRTGPRPARSTRCWRAAARRAAGCPGCARRPPPAPATLPSAAPGQAAGQRWSQAADGGDAIGDGRWVVQQPAATAGHEQQRPDGPRHASVRPRRSAGARAATARRPPTRTAGAGVPAWRRGAGAGPASPGSSAGTRSFSAPAVARWAAARRCGPARRHAAIDARGVRHCRSSARTRPPADRRTRRSSPRPDRGHRAGA